MSRHPSPCNDSNTIKHSPASDKNKNHESPSPVDESRKRQALPTSNNKTFPYILFTILSDDRFADALWWNSGGESFSMSPSQCCNTTLLGMIVQGRRVESFMRKLNRWGFRRCPVPRCDSLKVDADHDDAIAYYHPLFQQHQPDLVAQINPCHQKKKAKSPPPFTTQCSEARHPRRPTQRMGSPPNETSTLQQRPNPRPESSLESATNIDHLNIMHETTLAHWNGIYHRVSDNTILPTAPHNVQSSLLPMQSFWGRSSRIHFRDTMQHLQSVPTTWLNPGLSIRESVRLNPDFGIRIPHEYIPLGPFNSMFHHHGTNHVLPATTHTSLRRMDGQNDDLRHLHGSPNDIQSTELSSVDIERVLSRYQYYNRPTDR